MISRHRFYAISSIAFFAVALHYGQAAAFGKLGTACSSCHTPGASVVSKKAVASLAATATVAAKFHTGSSTECSECHVGSGSALRGSDSSSSCLRCHEAPAGTTSPKGYYVATSTSDLNAGLPPLQMTPGGDFGWLKKSYSWKSIRGSGSSSGERHGHNIVAFDYGYMSDSRLRGSQIVRYPSTDFSCTSCHDPHAKISPTGPFRLLAGKGYKSSAAPGIIFTADAPVAVAPVDYNRSEGATDTRVAYGSGMSEWCANCHVAGCGGRTHPAGKCANCGRETMSNYNAYVRSGNINGRAETAYTSLVPFEEGTTDKTLLTQHAQNNGSFTRGPESGANVMCLTCHRAHASGWNSMARWNMEGDFIVHNNKYPGTDNGSTAEHAQGRTSTDVQRALYDRPSSRFAAVQRGLCNKCHTKD